MSAEMKFEEAMMELEKVVQRLESGEPDLDEALRLFEKGVRLARICEQKLDKAEQTVKILLDENQEVDLSGYEKGGSKL